MSNEEMASCFKERLDKYLDQPLFTSTIESMKEDLLNVQINLGGPLVSPYIELTIVIEPKPKYRFIDEPFEVSKK